MLVRVALSCLLQCPLPLSCGQLVRSCRAKEELRIRVRVAGFELLLDTEIAREPLPILKLLLDTEIPLPILIPVVML